MENSLHTNKNNITPDDLFSKLDVNWDKSKEDVWQQFSEKLNNRKEDRIRRLKFYKAKLAAAAAILLIIGISALMGHYTKSVSTTNAQHLSYELSDGSKIYLNSNTTITYKPLLWYFSRKVNLKGEAFFEVTKGDRFVVESELGKTCVLGTSFNIFARTNNYRVTCLTGKVSVENKSAIQKIMLEPNQKAVIEKNGELKKSIDTMAKQSTLWMKNEFIFTSTPLYEVFEEIERQYNIKISGKYSPDYIYTGNFNKKQSVETTLDLVCRPFDITFVKISNNEYQLSNINNE